MKSIAVFASLLTVLLVSFFFISRHTAIKQADELMGPALKNGWSRFDTRLTLLSKSGPELAWWVRYELEDSFAHPLGVYVNFRGEVEDWEVREMLDNYRKAHEAEARSTTASGKSSPKKKENREPKVREISP